MAITESVLGPNSSLFTYSSTDTMTTILAAFDTYITAHGWEIYDNAEAAVGNALMSQTSNAAGRIYRTLQDGSTTQYKYVGIGLFNYSTNNMYYSLRIYESWNPTTHVGTNDGTYTNGSAVAYSAFYTNGVGSGNGNAFIVYANKKWLAIRARTNNLSYKDMIGAFEIRKDYGEDPTIPSVVFMSTNLQTNHPNTSNVNVFGSPRSAINGAVGSSVNSKNTISTAFGSPTYTGTNNLTLSYLTNTGVIPNGLLTMTAAELSTASYVIGKLRGRIMGVKLIHGAVNWNDQDLVQSQCDSDYFQVSANGTQVSHHVINVNSLNALSYVRYAIPA